MTFIFIAIIVFITIKAFLYKIALEQSILVFREYIKRHQYTPPSKTEIKEYTDAIDQKELLHAVFKFTNRVE